MNFPRSTAVSADSSPIPQKHYPYLKAALQSLYISPLDFLSACRGCAAPLKRRSTAFKIVKLLYVIEPLERSMF